LLAGKIAQELKVEYSERKTEINTSIYDKTYFLFRNKNENITIDQWCFSSNKFNISIEEIVLKQTKFKNQKEFKEALKVSSKREIS